MFDTEVQMTRLRGAIKAFRSLPSTTHDAIKRAVSCEILRLAEELRDRAYSLYCGKCKDVKVVLTDEQWLELDQAGRENIEVTCEACEPAKIASVR